MLFWFHPRNTIKEWETAGHEPKSKLELKHREWIVLLRFRRSNCSSAFSASCSTSRMNAKEADSFSSLNPLMQRMQGPQVKYFGRRQLVCCKKVYCLSANEFIREMKTQNPHQRVATC
ncbi:hypothetical protein GBA52_009796 [Prunus armeniaca]|nr:hypothetical protein GBA52_009796 [Prunus armeniaca]